MRGAQMHCLLAADALNLPVCTMLLHVDSWWCRQAGDGDAYHESSNVSPAGTASGRHHPSAHLLVESPPVCSHPTMCSCGCSGLVSWMLVLAGCLMAMHVVGVNIQPLLTVGGVSGVIVGLSAQSVMANMISGINLVSFYSL